MTNIVIINVYDGVNAATYTFQSWFESAADATTAINAMASYWVQEHGGQYVGYVKDEDGYVVKKDDEFVMIYYIQTLTNFKLDNVADSI